MKTKTFWAMVLTLSMLSATVDARDYDITAYGAKSDTTVLSTQALQQAIDDCSKAGGGRVVVPAGNY
jgi:polygalacturonase